MKHVKFQRGLILMAVLPAMSDSTACAQSWAELGDAGQNGVGAAQITIGVGALTNITGRASGVNDADIFCIRITDEAAFHARVTAFPSVDSMLWLFNPDGTLQVGNDDVGGLFAYLGSQGVFANGVYYLAFSSFNNDGLNAANTGLTDYNTWPGPFPQQWQGNGTVLTHWRDNGSYFGDYAIELSGAEFFAVPSPGAPALLGMGCLAPLCRRRR